MCGSPVHASSVAGARDLLETQASQVMKEIAHTGFLVAFAYRNDDHHDWPASEAARHLNDVGVVVGMVRAGLVEVVSSVATTGCT